MVSKAWPDTPAQDPCMKWNPGPLDECRCLRPHGHDGLHSCGAEGCSWPTSPTSDSLGQRPRVRPRGIDDDPRA